MEKPPGQNAGWIEKKQVPRDEEEKGRDDDVVRLEGFLHLRRTSARRRSPEQRHRRAVLYLSFGGGMRAPQEHTMLRVAHSMFSSRPQAGHAR